MDPLRVTAPTVRDRFPPGFLLRGLLSNGPTTLIDFACAFPGTSGHTKATKLILQTVDRTQSQDFLATGRNVAEHSAHVVAFQHGWCVACEAVLRAGRCTQIIQAIKKCPKRRFAFHRFYHTRDERIMSKRQVDTVLLHTRAIGSCRKGPRASIAGFRRHSSQDTGFSLLLRSSAWLVPARYTWISMLSFQMFTHVDLA